MDDFDYMMDVFNLNRKCRIAEGNSRLECTEFCIYNNVFYFKDSSQ
jgi:hypothetical protein